jgi:hypothetical protein
MITTWLIIIAMTWDCQSIGDMTPSIPPPGDWITANDTLKGIAC